MPQPLTTKIFICRDTLNNIENSILVPDTGVKVFGITKGTILSLMKNARFGMSVLRNYLNGVLVGNMGSYFTTLKYQILNSFSINGVTIDLMSQQAALSSVMSLGNKLTSQLLMTFVPSQYLAIFQSIGWGSNPNAMNLFNELIALYVPSEFQAFFSDLLITMDTISAHLNTVSQTVNAQITATTGSTSMLTPSAATQQVNNIVSSIQDNTQGLDIPIPVIDLTESQALYNQKQ